MDASTAETGARRLLAELEEYLAGPGRPLVPHGFEIKAVRSERRPNVWAPDIDALTGSDTTVELRVPVIWEPEGVPARASETPTMHNLDELRDLIEYGCIAAPTGSCARAR